jgi:hypothetical protein
MSEKKLEAVPNVAENGVDLTLIRELLAMTPGERLEMIVKSSKNVAELFESARR